MRVFVDLDGVVVNFHEPASKAFPGIVYPKEGILDFTWLYDQVKHDHSVADFMGKIEALPNFWPGLRSFAWMPELIQILEENCSDNWYFLSAASQNPESWSGKADWVKRYFGVKGIHRLILVHGAKTKVVSSDAILIDDKLEHCKDWQDKGGLGAFHWIEYTDDYEHRWKHQLYELQQFLGKFQFDKN